MTVQWPTEIFRNVCSSWNWDKQTVVGFVPIYSSELFRRYKNNLFTKVLRDFWKKRSLYLKIFFGQIIVITINNCVRLHKNAFNWWKMKYDHKTNFHRRYQIWWKLMKNKILNSRQSALRPLITFVQNSFVILSIRNPPADVIFSWSPWIILAALRYLASPTDKTEYEKKQQNISVVFDISRLFCLLLRCTQTEETP